MSFKGPGLKVEEKDAFSQLLEAIQKYSAYKGIHTTSNSISNDKLLL
jgi:hypothetical protein